MVFKKHVNFAILENARNMDLILKSSVIARVVRNPDVLIACEYDKWEVN